MNFKICLGSSSKTIGDREKEWKMEIKKIEYFENEKSFLDGIKINNMFHIFQRPFI